MSGTSPPQKTSVFLEAEPTAFSLASCEIYIKMIHSAYVCTTTTTRIHLGFVLTTGVIIRRRKQRVLSWISFLQADRLYSQAGYFQLIMYPSFINLHEDENDHHLLLDMDSFDQVVKQSNFLASRGCEPVKKKCSLGDESEQEVDGTGWSDKPIRSWCQEETINWLMSAASYLGQPYSSIQHSLAVPGKEIIAFTRQDFINQDPVYGNRLYDLLHSQRISNLLPSFDTIQLQSEDEYARVNSSNISDAESDNSIEIATKRLPGRPRVLKTKKNPASQGKLWEFIRDLLRNRETCPSLICWEDYSQAKFRFVKSDEVAKRWGSRKGNTKMTYEKLSRAMRYYYKSKIFLPVLGRRLVYQFGPNAKGWQTDNPNFRH